jgi:hypothetical protein
MTNDVIQEEVTKLSRFWTDAGTWNLGRAYLEILGCDDLPNLDTLFVEFDAELCVVKAVLLEDVWPSCC